MSFPPNLGITRVLLIDSSPIPSFYLPNLDQFHLQFSRNKMNNGYSRIRKTNTTKSKSVDFAELPSLHQEPISDYKFQQTTPTHNTVKRSRPMHDSIPEHEDEGGIGEALQEILNENKVSTQQQGCLSSQNLVKNFRSKKRSTSISEGYSKIHQLCDDLTVEDDDDHTATKSTFQKTYTKKKGKFLKACRRLFGL